MRRWRLPDGRTLVEAPAAHEAGYYLLDPEGEVERAYGDSKTTVDGELHQVGYYVLGRQLMCRHTVERTAGGKEDLSRLEADGLDLLSPQEKPTLRDAQDAIAVYRKGAGEVEKGRRERIDKIAAQAPASTRDMVRRLAERIVYEDDDLAREMMQALAAMAKLRREVDEPTGDQRRATEAVQLAARLMTFDPKLAAADLPEPPESETLSLVRKLQSLQRDVVAAATRHDRAAGVPGQSDASRAYLRTAKMLELAILHLSHELEL